MVPVEPAGPAPGVLDRLLERRIVLLAGRLDDQAATSAAAQLMLLDVTGDAPIDLRLSCPDGDLDPATALAATIDLVGVPVRAWCTGGLGGPALAPFAAAGRRLAHPHAVFVLQEPTVHAEGRADELAAVAARHRQQLAALHRRLARATGRSVERVATDMRAGVSLTAHEARAYGLVDEVVGGHGGPGPRPGGC